jgi:hypothetical protein
MSDQELGKKMIEEEELYLFLDAYAIATGDYLGCVRPSERPDFICGRSDSSLVGVELTRIMRDPDSALWDRIMNYREFRDPMEANDHIWPMAEWKSKKLKAGKWDCSNNTILVLQVMDCPLSDLHRYIEDSTSPEDYADLGFSEIWVADYSELDAYRAIEVFGLYPEECWGYHERDRGKPYG